MDGSWQRNGTSAGSVPGFKINDITVPFVEPVETNFFNALCLKLAFRYGW